MQGKYDEAAAEYRKILEMNPLLPGIHYRLGRVLLAKPDPSPAAVTKSYYDTISTPVSRTAPA